MKTSLVIPAFNEEERLPPFLDSITAYLQTHQNTIQEVLLVDDGSTDNTIKKAKEYENKIPQMRIMQLEQNAGKGAALKKGIFEATGDYLIFTDADGATPIEEMGKMMHALTKTQIAIGNRWMKGSKTERDNLLRRISGYANKTYMNMFGLKGIDVMCGFKGFHKDIGRDLFSNLIENRWLFDTEITYKAVKKGYTITNFPISWEAKDGSKLPASTLIKSAFQIWPLIRKINKQIK